MDILQGIAGLFFIGGIICCFLGKFLIGTTIIVISLLATGLIEKATKKQANPQLTLNLPKLDTERAELLQESFKKAIADYNFLQQAQSQIKDKALLVQLEKMQRIAKNFLCYLQKQPEKIPLARRFIDYYQDRAVLLVKKYLYLEETQLQADDIIAIKTRMKQSLDKFDEAYSEQFTKVMSEQIMDINAELNVMQQMFDDDGIKEKKTTDTSSSYTASGPFSSSQTTPPKINSFDDFIAFSQTFENSLRQKGCRRRQCMDIRPSENRSKALQRKIVAALLAIFFGGFGAHKFYLRKNFLGIIFILFCWTGIPSLVGFIEGIRYLFMSTDDFYLQYLE